MSWKRLHGWLRDSWAPWHLDKKIRWYQDDLEPWHQDERIPKVCLKKDCMDGCMIHEHRDTFSNRSDDVEMTKSPSIKMSTSYDIYASYIYQSYCSKCVLKKTASLVVWSMNTVTLIQIGSDDIEMTKDPWTTMSISFNTHASWSYSSCYQNWSQKCLWRAKRTFHFDLRTAQVSYLCDPKKIFLQMKSGIRLAILYQHNH